MTSGTALTPTPALTPALTLARIRITLVMALGVVLGAIAGGIFDDVKWELLLVAPLVAGMATVTAHRLSPLRAAGAAVACAVAVLGTVLVAGGTPTDAFPGVLRGPRRLISTEWPSPDDPILIGAVALLIAASTAVAAELARRERPHLTVLLAPLVALVVLLGCGAPTAPPMPLTVTFGVLAAGVALARPGDPAHLRIRTLAGERTLLATTVLVGLSVLTTAGAVAWADRADPRRIQEPDLSAVLLDPIESIVALRDVEPALDLARIDLDDGTPIPTRWRIAALDAYDGQRWTPLAALRPIGGRLADDDPPAVVRYELTYLTDDLDLVPFPGRPIAVGADVETDLDRVAVRLATRPAPGTTVRVAAAPPSRVPSPTAPVVTRQIDETVGGFSERAATLAGDGTVVERLSRMAETMRSDWRLDSAAPGGGHQLALIERFVTDTQRGTREQFVTAFVLLARSLGIEARVATGFAVPPEEAADPLTLSSAEAAAWAEIAVDGVGWVAFDPVPPDEAPDDDAPLPPPEAQSPAAAQPPIAPPAEDTDGDEDEVVVDTADDGGWAAVRSWAIRLGAGAAIAVLPLLIAAGTIVLLKWRRRRRRVTADDPATRIRGAWANATDSFVDAGLDIAPAWTDDRIAERAAGVAPAAPHEMRRLASMATAVTFGPTIHADRLAPDAVATAASIDDAIRAGRTRRERLRWRLSLRSLRTSTRSPVVA